MNPDDYRALTAHGKLYASLTPEDEALLREAGPRLRPRLPHVTDGFYQVLLSIPEARPLLEGRMDKLRNTHLEWLERLFTGPYDADFTRYLYDVGATHVRVRLPVEFMACGITQIGNHLLAELATLYGDDGPRLARTARAISAVLGFSQIIMQESYQSSLLAQELDRFLAITGISRTLFENLARSYRDGPSVTSAHL